MPAYNCEDFIDEAIQSIVNQKYTDFELLITDDGGTDGTAEKVQCWVERDSRIHFFTKENGDRFCL